MSRRLKNSVTLNSPALSVLKNIVKGTFRRPTGFGKHQSVTNIFSAEETVKLPELVMSATQEDSLRLAMHFPGTTRVVVAKEALDHLERNLARFETIFNNFHIPKSNYRLLAGFDEDLIRGRLGFLNQIHIFILSEPPNMDSFLSYLLPVLEKFSAYVFTNKFTYRLPSALSDFGEILRSFTHRTAEGLPSCLSTMASNVDMSGQSIFGGPKGQESNGKGDSTRKGKEREDIDGLIPPDSGQEGDLVSESPASASHGSEARDAEITFRVATQLFQRAERFQGLQVKGVLKIKRIPESQVPLRFATCDVEFTELLTTSETTPGEPTYHHFQLNVHLHANNRWAFLTRIHPVSTPKYGPQSKVSNAAKRMWNSTLSGALSVVKPQGTIGASASRTAESSTSTEKTLNISRIIQSDIGPDNSWAFHIDDPFNREVGLPLPPEKLPFVHIRFHGKTRAPPPKYLDVEISTYWSALSLHGGNAWLSFPSTGPAFSNLCKIITLHLPSDLQGSHLYDAGLLVWPKRLGTNPFMCTTADEIQIQGDVENLGSTKVAETPHTMAFRRQDTISRAATTYWLKSQGIEQ